MFRRLLVPLDGSPLSEAVLPMAGFLAKQSGASVTLLHVVEHHAPATVHGARHLTTADEAEDYLAEIADSRFPPEVSVDRHVHRRQVSDVAHSVADHADELESDLVVMLVHGRWDFRRWLSGTLGQKILRQAPSPVLLLQPGADGAVPVPFRHILVPLDGRPEHESGLNAAVELARLCSAPLRLLTVVPTLTTLRGEQAAASQLLPSATHEMLELAERGGVDYLQQHLERVRTQGLTAAATVARGDPATVIQEIAAQQQVDLVALGTHGSAGVEAFWSGSVGQKLIGKIPASFLLAPAEQSTR